MYLNEMILIYGSTRAAQILTHTIRGVDCWDVERVRETLEREAKRRGYREEAAERLLQIATKHWVWPVIPVGINHAQFWSFTIHAMHVSELRREVLPF